MIHDYGYEQAIPYKFIKYKKQDKVEFTEEIKSELDNYYRDIRKLTESNYQIDGKADIKKLSKDLGGKYKSIRARFIIPFTGKESYSSQELDFLFVCCYELYLKFQLNQTEMSKIWGINGDKLERLDWYPHRSFSAYHSVCDKTLKPYDTDSLGAKIAKVMKEIKDFIAKYSVNYHKGYFYSRPIEFSKFKSFINSTWPVSNVGLIKGNRNDSFGVDSILSMIPGGFLIYADNEEEKILSVNEMLLSIFECDTVEDFIELTKESFSGMVHPEDLSKVRDRKC